jgi:hypothetical protein
MIKKLPLWLREINEDDGKITYYNIIEGRVPLWLRTTWIIIAFRAMTTFGIAN